MASPDRAVGGRGRVLTPARFGEVYQAAFPGCRITELYRARVVQYQATAAAG